MLGLGTFAIPVNGAELTLIHIGDIHGHLTPRPSLPGDAARTNGGLARMYAKIKEIRARRGSEKTLLLNTGDTIQGSAEALYTRGQALVDVLNAFRIDAFAPGNWDWVYGVDRVLELWGGPNAKAPWNALAANAYYDGEPYSPRKGERVLPPYLVREVNGIRVGLLGFTTDRGPQVVGRGVTKGVRFTKGDDEFRHFVKLLREQEKVSLVVVLSELGVANNLRLAEQTPGADVILSSDSHEITREPVRTDTHTLIAEAGQDGQTIGELHLTVEDGRITQSKWTIHSIDERIPPDAGIARAVAEVRKPFLSGPGFKPQVNPFNGTRLERPIDTVVGRAAVALHRMDSTGGPLPAVIAGSSHALLTDAFRAATDADVGAIRGFRYGTVVRPGPITLEDLYHFVPIGPLLAKGTVKGKQLKAQIENSADGSLNPDVSKWTGGWLFNFSGVKFDLDPFGKPGARASNILVFDRASKSWQPLDPERDYTYASYFYARDPDLINATPVRDVSVVKDRTGAPVDVVELVVRYLSRLPNRTAAPDVGRISLVKPLPAPTFGSPEIQPWRGAREPQSETGRTAPDDAGLTYHKGQDR